MKMKRYLPVLVTLLGLAVLMACQKSMTTVDQLAQPQNPVDQSTNQDPADSVVHFPLNFTWACSGAPDYGDSIIFMQPSINDYIVSPINHPDSGQYFSWPKGMVIDQHTGAINVSRSEGGLRYDIGYVKNGTTDTCMQTLILAGASYADSIYVLGDNQRYAKPYYNADPNLVSVCSGSGVPGGSTCQFDINSQAKNQGIKVDNNNGYIDLQNTLSDAFGLLPANGATVNTTIAYKLSDNSNMATQYVPVTLVYYNKRSDIPAGLLDMITQKLDKILNQVLVIDIFNPGAAISKTSPRPPIIVVTRYK